MAALILVLQAVDYWLLMKTTRLEVYIGILALVFVGVGIWFGTTVINKEQKVSLETVPPINPDQFDISNREYEVLELMATGMTNHEIAKELFISVNTVKTHIGSLYTKLDVGRRTQAVRRARELQLIRD